MSNKYLSKAAGLASGKQPAPRASLTSKMGLGLSALGLGTSLANYSNNQQFHKMEQQRLKLEQDRVKLQEEQKKLDERSLRALGSINKALRPPGTSTR